MSQPDLLNLDLDLDPEIDEAPEAAESGGFSLVLWLLVMSAAILFLPLLLTANRLDEENLRLSAGLLQMQTQAADYALPGAGSEELQATLTQAEALLAELEPVYSSLSGSQIDWPEVIGLIMTYDINLLAVDGLAQTDNRLVISGRAETEAAVLAYASSLEASGRFSRVVVQAITVNVAPTPTSALQPRPASGVLLVRADAPIEFTILVEIKAVTP